MSDATVLDRVAQVNGTAQRPALGGPLGRAAA